MTPSILLFGATSLLGFHLATRFSETILPFISPGNTNKTVRHWPQLDLQDSGWLAEVFSRTQPITLLYVHAVCDVAKCEAFPDWAYEINVQQLARVLETLPAYTRLVYVSSDHVFGGDGRYDEYSETCPISVYGQTRVEAERLALRRPGTLVIRTGLGIGHSHDGRSGHLDWLRHRTKKKLPITIIKDEYRSAVWQCELAQRVMQLARSREAGIRHISATHATSRLDLAQFLNEHFGINAVFKVESRHQQATPHIGRVELLSVFQQEQTPPLASVVGKDGSPPDSCNTQRLF